MKLTPSISALVAILGLALASAPVSLKAQTTDTTTAAAANPSAPAPAKTKKSKPTEYEGNLSAIDPTANTISVASTTKVLTMTISPKTTIQINKKKAALTDFAVGDKVTGSYTKDATTGVLTAHSLRKKTTSMTTAAKTATDAATSAAPAAVPTPAMPAGQ